MVRLAVSEDQPLAVQQWQGLIAINYAARAHGLSRHVTVQEAKKVCPELIVQHVATWREGDDRWAYREDAWKHITTDKVSLDPYRLQSRKILDLIKTTLPPQPLQKVEKASIDEVFLDLSAHIHSILLERYPELHGPPPYDDPTENLPMPPTTVLDWQADALVDLDVDETEDDDPDWDDIVMLIGSEIVRDVRKAIRDQLKYTCSAGIAKNKFLAKLGSGHRKPNQQTVIRNRAIQQFLSEFKFTKIRNLGGKLGDQVVSTFGTDELVELLKYPVEQLKSKLGDDTGAWLYGVIRGEDTSEVNSRTQIKSMLSAKSFRPSINTPEQAVRWLRIFVADIFARLVEEGVLENKRRPKTLNLHHRQGGTTKSRQIPIPQGKKIDETVLFDLSKTLLGQVIGEGRAWPCANLSLSVGGFEDGVTGNRGIGSFLLRGDEAKAINTVGSGFDSQNEESSRPDKRRRVGGVADIQHFFNKNESNGEHDEEFDAHDHTPEPGHVVDGIQPEEPYDSVEHPTTDGKANLMGDGKPLSEGPISNMLHSHPGGEQIERSNVVNQKSITSYFCDACQRSIPEIEREEHQDWHFAKDLQAEEVPGPRNPVNQPSGHNGTKQMKRVGFSSVRGGRKQQSGKGQKKLAFG